MKLSRKELIDLIIKYGEKKIGADPRLVYYTVDLSSYSRYEDLPFHCFNFKFNCNNEVEMCEWYFIIGYDINKDQLRFNLSYMDQFDDIPEDKLFFRTLRSARAYKNTYYKKNICSRVKNKLADLTEKKEKVLKELKSLNKEIDKCNKIIKQYKS